MKKHFCALVIALVCGSHLRSQQIFAGEYFFNEEPGLGQGIPISFAAENDVEFTIDIPTEALPDGFNYLFVRFLNENGLWSMTESRNFLVLPSEQQTQLTSIIAAEYFIDTEPG
ncbi:MAG: hypothetical protein JNM00_14965, partial [Flavobacteriales bacterium]|nr:hypothetical protein [Flavobacteriales bacterium]